MSSSDLDPNISINALTVLPDTADKTGETGESGNHLGTATNMEFVEAVFPNVPEGAFVAVCTKPGDPNTG